MNAPANCSIPPRRSCAPSARRCEATAAMTFGAAISHADVYPPKPRSLIIQSRRALGLTLPSTSKLVDGLVNQKIITRRESKEDRRRLTLSLTKSGEEILRMAREATQNHLKDVLRELSADELSTIIRAMNLLQPLFMKGMKETK